MSTFNITANFNAAALGPMTLAAKQTVWGGMPHSTTYGNIAAPAPQLYDADPNGTYFSIVTGGKTGGQCCRMWYPAGVAGEGLKYYQIQCGQAAFYVNVEFDVLFEPGFDFATPAVGKIAPQIVWGGRTGANGGAEQFAIWNGATNTKFSPIVQNQQSPSSYPSQFISPPNYAAVINTNQWYHWKYQFMGGPGGWSKHWLDGTLLNYTLTTTGNTTSTNNVTYEFGFWAGGTVGPAVDGYVRQDNVHIWSLPDASTYSATFAKS